MFTVRRAEERGLTALDWLESRHSFSFDTYYDPQHMGFRALRVINEDRVAPGHGFPLHPHHDMEILSLVLSGTLRHRDDMGNEELIGAGEMQRISAGHGVRHSEDNPSSTESVHFLQIWIEPSDRGLEPSYEQRSFVTAARGALRLLASADGREGSVRLHQDASLYLGDIEAGGSAKYALSSARHGWLQMLRGDLFLNGRPLREGDGAAVSDEERLMLEVSGEARFLLFDLA